MKKNISLLFRTYFINPLETDIFNPYSHLLFIPVTRKYFLEILKRPIQSSPNIFPLYYMHSDVCIRLKSLTIQYCILRYVRVKLQCISEPSGDDVTQYKTTVVLPYIIMHVVGFSRN